MEKYMDYLRCGEIYKSPSQSDRSPYILKCFHCADVFLLLESFIFHVEDHCLKEAECAAEDATVTSNIESEISCEEEQKFSITMLDENFTGLESIEDVFSSEINKDAAAANAVSMETEEDEIKPTILEEINETNELENEEKDDCIILEDPVVEIKNEPIYESDDEIYVSDDSDRDIDKDIDKGIHVDTSENATAASCSSNSQSNVCNDDYDDTDSATEDDSNDNFNYFVGDNSAFSFIKDFMGTPTNVTTLINVYKNHPKLWNTKLYPYSDENETVQSGLKSFTHALNEQLQLSLRIGMASKLISYVLRNFMSKLRSMQITSKHNRIWYFEQMSFLKPYVKSNMFEGVNKGQPIMTPEIIIKIIKIYKTFPQLWNSDCMEFCSRIKRAESEKMMLRVLQNQINFKNNLTLYNLQQYLRSIHAYFSREKYKYVENDGNDVCPMEIDDTDYYKYLQFLTNHVSPFKCLECDEFFKCPFQMKLHMAKHTGTIPFTCPLCKRGFWTVWHYVKHAREHFNEHVREHFSEACSLCDKKFSTSPELESHRAAHHQHTCYKCKICEKIFISNAALASHIRIHKKIELQKIVFYKCRMCEKIIKKEYIEIHMQTNHMKNGLYTCQVCEESFPYLKALVAHHKLHVKTK